MFNTPVLRCWCRRSRSIVKGSRAVTTATAAGASAAEATTTLTRQDIFTCLGVSVLVYIVRLFSSESTASASAISAKLMSATTATT